MKKDVLLMENCSIRCEVANCRNYSEGFCGVKADNLVIMQDSLPVCADFKPINAEKTALAKGLLDKIKEIYADMYDDADLAADMEVDLEEQELCTDGNNTCFVLIGNNLQDFVCDERIAALVDARNVIIGGKPSIVTFEE